MSLAKQIDVTLDLSVDGYASVIEPVYYEDENIYKFSITIENPAGTPVDLTSLTPKLLVGKTNTKGTAQAVTIDNAAGGVVSYTIADTDDLYTSIGDYRAVLVLEEAPDLVRHYKAYEFTVDTIY